MPSFPKHRVFITDCDFSEDKHSLLLLFLSLHHIIVLEITAIAKRKQIYTSKYPNIICYFSHDILFILNIIETYFSF